MDAVVMPLTSYSLLALLPDPTSQESAAWLILGLSSLVFAADRFQSVILNWRKLRAPAGTDTGVDDKIASLQREIREVELRLERRLGENLGEIKTRMASLETTISHLVSDFSRALGVLEGESKAAANAAKKP
jgi:hypothetical protein